MSLSMDRIGQPLSTVLFWHIQIDWQSPQVSNIYSTFDVNVAKSIHTYYKVKNNEQFTLHGGSTACMWQYLIYMLFMCSTTKILPLSSIGAGEFLISSTVNSYFTVLQLDLSKHYYSPDHVYFLNLRRSNISKHKHSYQGCKQSEFIADKQISS